MSDETRASFSAIFATTLAPVRHVLLPVGIQLALLHFESPRLQYLLVFRRISLRRCFFMLQLKTLHFKVEATVFMLAVLGNSLLQHLQLSILLIKAE